MVGFDKPLAAGTVATPEISAAGVRHLEHAHDDVPAHEHLVYAGRTHLAWGAVIAGALTALALMILSSYLAAAFGVPAFRGLAYGFGSAVWCVLTAAVAFFFGGMMVSYFSPRSEMYCG